MRRSILTSVLCVSALALTFALPATAAVPGQINYQGWLTDGSGNPVPNGTYSVTFTIYGSPGGADAKWAEALPVTTTGGRFTALLGSTVLIDDGVFYALPRYLGIKVGADPEMTPRTMLASVPWAFRVATVDSAAGGTITGPVKVVGQQSTIARFESSIGVTDTGIVHAEYTGSDMQDAVAVSGKSTPQDYFGIGGRFEGGYIGTLSIARPGGSYPSAHYLGAWGQASGGNARNTGMWGLADSCWGATGVIGTARAATEYAIGVDGGAYGSSPLPGAYGVMGTAVSSATRSYGVAGFAIDSPAVYSYGVYGQANGSPNSNIGVFGTASGPGTAYAGYFSGSVHVSGTLSKGGGSFLIDHPLDPENKYLQHSFVESPDMMNVYNGNAVIGPDGRATVELPSYFDALNRDFRYQLTPVGAPMPDLYVAQKIDGNRFVIGGGVPGMEVSWQVTGIRKDPWAEANRIPVESDKPAMHRGTYLNPELYGAPQSKATYPVSMQPPSRSYSPLTGDAPGAKEKR